MQGLAARPKPARARRFVMHQIVGLRCLLEALASGGLLDSLDAPTPRAPRSAARGRAPLVRSAGRSCSRPDVPERDADIAQKAAALDSLDRRAAEKLAELLVIEREEIAQPHLRDRWAAPRTRSRAKLARSGSTDKRRGNRRSRNAIADQAAGTRAGCYPFSSIVR